MARPELIVAFLSGGLVAAYTVAALFFLRFWTETRDSLFAYFAIAFITLAAQRVLMVSFGASTLVYLVRLLAFLIILWAIIDKNRPH